MTYEEQLQKVGDELQSAASRMAHHLRMQPLPPYEVQMAVIEAEGAVEAWTEARRNA